MEDQEETSSSNDSEEEAEFTGAVAREEENKEDVDPLKPKARDMESWKQQHQEHIRRLKKKEAECIIIGDSIMKHLDKASITKKKDWKAAMIENFGLKIYYKE